MKGCILPFSKKGDLGLAKNYRGITLTSIAANIYNALLRNCIEPKIENILRKNQNGFRRNKCTTSQILTIRNNSRRCYHHHHVMPLARISLTLSCHFSLSFIASGRSSGLHPVSSHSC